MDATPATVDLGPADAGPIVARVVECAGPDAGRVHQLRAGTYVIGRGRTADISLRDADISREHARLVVSLQGAKLIDAGSKNGVEADGERVHGERRLEHGAQLTLGNVSLELEHDATRVRQALTAAGEVTITRVRPEAKAPAPPSSRLPLLATAVFGVLVLVLAIWGR